MPRCTEQVLRCVGVRRRTWPCAARGNRIALSEPIDVRMRCDQLRAQVRARAKHRVVHAITVVDDMLQA